MGNKLGRKLYSTVALFSLLTNLFLPLLSAQIVLAEEATPSAEVSVSPTPSANLTSDFVATPSLPADATQSALQAGITVTPTSVWQDNGDGSQQTINNVALNEKYTAPQNDKVTVTFNKLPDNPGKLSVKEVKLTPDQVKQTKALSDTAYDISSTMTNGTFEYTLTLPTTKTDKVEVKASEDGSSFITVGGVTAQTDTLTITGLNHFTIFVIAGVITSTGPGTFVGEPFNESSSQVVINEFVHEPSSGNEWVELFNKTGSDINLSTWTIEDSATHSRSLSGTIPANGILVYENTGAEFLNNTTADGDGDVIYLKNSGTTVDKVTYQKEANGTTIDNTSSVASVAAGQSLYRTSDGGSTWNVTSTPTKGWFNSGVSVAAIVFAISGAGITTNLGTSGITNPAAASGLYFEKTGKGKITFSSTLNLTDASTASLLQDLGTKLDMNTSGHIAFDASTATLLKNAGATLVMYGLDEEGFTGTPEIVVRDDEGVVLIPDSDDYPTLSGISFSGGNLTFSTDHFTQFDTAKVRNTTTGEGFDTIQAAIDDADTTDGDIINVTAGSYAETVTVNKAVDITGSGSPSTTKFILTTNPVTISGFNVTAIDISGSGKVQNAVDGISANGTINIGAGTYDEAISIGKNLTIIGAGNTTIIKKTAGTALTVTTGTVSISQIKLAGSNTGLNVTGGNVTISDSEISGNSTKGINAGVGVTQVTASNNYWGSGTGPTHSSNSGGTGDTISDNVKYRKFYTDSARSTASTSSIDSSSFSPSTFFSSGVFSLPSGESDQTNVSQVNVDQQVTLNVSVSGGTSSVVVPAGVSITKTGGGNIDSTLLSAANTSSSSLSGLGTGVVADGAMQWGIPNIGLTFSSAITLHIYVGTSFNGQTLDIVRSSSTSSGWTSDGISSPATCLVSDGICTFQATKASYYATTHTSSSSTSSSSDSLTSSAGTPGSAPVCTDTKPGSAPVLFLASSGPNQATLGWTKALDPVTYYLLAFGLSSGVMQYGNPDIGGQNTTSYTVSGLSGGTTYYFRVRAGNGCMPGDYSGEVAVTPGGVALSSVVPSGFQEGVLGTTTTEATPSAAQTLGADTVSPTPQPKIVAGVLGNNLKSVLIVMVVLAFGWIIFRFIKKPSR